MKKNAIIIGAGIGGLATAIRLALKSYDVSVYEKNSESGGKLTSFDLGEYCFDFGPSLFTMPQYVDELFKLAGKDPKDYFDFIEMDEACRYFYEDGTRFIAKTAEDEFLNDAVEIFDIDREALFRYMQENKKIFENAGKVFLENSIHKFKTWLSPTVLKSMTHAYVLDMLKSMHTVTSRKIKDPKLVQLFDRYATYNGSSPFLASSILNSISSLEHQYGTYFPVGGMSSIAESIEKLALDLGVKFYFNKKVDEILVENGIAVGIHVEDMEKKADLVISNMDISFSYSQLLRKQSLKLPAREKSSSAVIFYWGVKREFEELGLHNIFFSNNYEKEFEEIFKDKRIPLDPTIYINVSSKFHKSDAPKGSENWFVMINVPADFGQNWDEELKVLRKSVIAKLSKSLKVDLTELIEQEYIADPRIIESKTLSHKGALYGNSSNHWLSAFLRHPNFSRKISNLYFVGGSVHPGGGIPLCLLSAKIATELID